MRIWAAGFLLALARCSSFYLRTVEQELCIAEFPQQNEQLVLDVSLRGEPEPGVFLYIFVRSSLRTSKSPLDSFVLQEQKQARFIYHHDSAKEVFFCLHSFADMFVSLRIERALVAAPGLLTAGDLHSLEHELYTTTVGVADFKALNERFIADEEAVLQANAAVDRRLSRLSLVEAVLLLAVCAAQYLVLARAVRAGGGPKPAFRL